MLATFREINNFTTVLELCNYPETCAGDACIYAINEFKSMNADPYIIDTLFLLENQKRLAQSLH